MIEFNFSSSDLAITIVKLNRMVNIIKFLNNVFKIAIGSFNHTKWQKKDPLKKFKGSKFFLIKYILINFYSDRTSILRPG